MKKFSLLFLTLILVTFNFFLATPVTAQGNSKIKKSNRPIPNSYIVVLQDDVSGIDQLLPPILKGKKVKDIADDLTAVYGGKVNKLYKSALKGFSVEMSEKQVEALSNDDRVKYVEEDFVVKAEEVQMNAPWGLDRIDQSYSNLDGNYYYDTTGTGVHAYVVDTGIRSTHTEFGGRVQFGADFVGDGQNGNDCNGHGTHVSGIIGGATYGVAKNVTIHNVRVLGCDGTGTGSAVLAGIEWITSHHVSPAVANMSLGSDEPSTTIENAITNSIAQGVQYSLAAGNGDPAIDACNHSPGGRVPTAMTVAATARGDFIAWFSNYGPCVDIFAPGEDITSAWNTSDTATARISGTSMAAPHVAGVIARLLQANPTASPAQLKNAILTWASPVVVNGGKGSPRAFIYSNTSLTSVPPVSSITIPHQGTANPYPSTFVVSGAPNVLSTKPGSLQVNIKGFTSLYADHIVMVLVGPDGTAMMLQQQTVSYFSAYNVSYTISDTGFGGFMGYVLEDGWSFRPTSDVGGYVSFPAPGPGTNYVVPGRVASPWQTLSGTFGGKNPNGTWKLYAMDNGSDPTHFDTTIDSWSISINNPPPPYVPSPTEIPSPTPTPTTSPTPTPTPTPVAVYDLVTDFSANSNPNGVWSYGYSNPNVSTINLFANSGEPWTGIKSWSPKPDASCCGMVTKNTTGGPLVYYGTIVHDPKFLYMETGPYGENTTVRWVAPVAGTYQLRGRFQALDTGYGAIFVKIKRNSNSFELLSGYLQNYGKSVDYNYTLTLNANEYLDFSVGEPNGPYYYGTGLSATISRFDSPTPTPTPTPTGTPTPSPTPTPSITPTPTPGTRMNFALAASGGVASASSQFNSSYAPAAVIDGDRKGLNWGSGGGWNDATQNIYPDWLQVDFNATQTVDEIDVFTVQDNFANPVDPVLTDTFSQYGITGFDIQYWNGSVWATAPSGSITNNNKVWTKITFPAVQTTKVRVLVNAAQAGYSRIVEVEAWGGGSSIPTPTPTPTVTPTSTPTPMPTPVPGVPANVALASNGGLASASSQYSDQYPASSVIDGDRKGLNWGSGGGWNDATANGYPDWLQVDFNASQTINEIDVFTIQDNFANPVDPTESMTFGSYGVSGFELQYWDGFNWLTVPNSNIVNNKVWAKFVFSPIATSKIRVVINAALANYSRLVEVEAWSVASTTPTPSPTPPLTRTNFALSSNGGLASASSQYSDSYPAASTIDGDRKGLDWGNGGGWNDATGDTYPDWLEVDFNGSQPIDEVDIFTVQDNYANPVEPTDTDTFSQYGITDFNIQYWTGSNWVTVPNGSITNSNKVWTKVTFAALQTTKIRVVINGAKGYSRIVEVEAWGGGAPTPTPTPTPGVHTNVAFASNGGVATASSQYSNSYPASAVIDGDRKGINWGNGGGWNDATSDVYPDWLQVDFNGSQTIDEIDVFTVQDNYANPVDPALTDTFTQYGITAFDIQYWNGSAWVTVPNGSITNNNKVWTKVAFPAVQTTKIRALVNAANGYSRIVEVEAYAWF